MDNPIIVALDALDYTTARETAKKLQGSVWGFKVNDLYFEMGLSIVEELAEFGNVMLDAKLHDIPNTVANTTAKMKDTKAAIVTVHASGGQTMIRAAADNLPGRVAAVTVLTSHDMNECKAIFGHYTTEAVEKLAYMARDGGAAYIVCSAKELDMPIFEEGDVDLPKIVPGIRPVWYQTPDDQKRTATPVEAIQLGAKFLVMGRPILRADDPVKAAQDTLDEIQKG